jgi:hypothetical protein
MSDVVPPELHTEGGTMSFPMCHHVGSDWGQPPDVDVVVSMAPPSIEEVLDILKTNPRPIATYAPVADG